jgi:hypothetical protein
MANKHGAGCTCCGEGDCGPCTETITTIAASVGSDTYSWTINQAINAIPGCSLVLRYCSTPVEYEIVDYSAAVAWDGTQGDCWKAFYNSWLPGGSNVDCCNPQGGGGPGGGGFEGVGYGEAFGGPGGGPVPAGSCVPCSTWYNAKDYEEDPFYQNIYTQWGGCKPTEYYVFTFKVEDIELLYKVTMWQEASLLLTFAPAGSQQQITATFGRTVYAQTDKSIRYKITAYYNDNCPRNSDCTIIGATCDEGGLGGLMGFFYCLFGQQQFASYQYPAGTPDPLYSFRFMDCSVDAPNWVEMTTSSFCFSSSGYHGVECDRIAPCASGENDSDENWWTDRPNNPTCAAINKTTYEVNQLSGPGWPTPLNDLVTQLLDFTTIFDSSLGIEIGGQTGGFDEICGSFDMGPVGGGIYGTCQEPCRGFGIANDQFQGTLTVDCDDVCGNHTINRAFGATKNSITMTWTTCPVHQCNPSTVNPEACRWWLDDCCQGTDPADTTLPVNFTSSTTATITINCQP